jgi:N-acetylglutamate synthase
MPEITITPMTPADIQSALALWQSTENMGLSPEDDSPAGLAKFLARNPGLSQVARDPSDPANPLVGAVLAGHDGRRGKLFHLAVAPGFMCKGVGRRLLEAATAALEREGIRKCYIYIYKANTHGREFWRKRGWREQDEFDYMFMTRDLDPTEDANG